MPLRGDAEPLLTPSSPHSAGGDGHGAKFLLGGAAGPPGLRPEPLQHGHEEDAAQHLLQRVGVAGRCRDRPGHSRALPRRVGRRGQVRSCHVRCAPTAAVSTHGCPWHGLGGVGEGRGPQGGRGGRGHGQPDPSLSPGANGTSRAPWRTTSTRAPGASTTPPPTRPRVAAATGQKTWKGVGAGGCLVIGAAVGPQQAGASLRVPSWCYRAGTPAEAQARCLCPGAAISPPV